MTTDPPDAGVGPETAGRGAAEGPSEEELRASYEAELSRITSTDMMVQAVVSLLNIAAHRLAPAAAETAAGAPAPGRDLEQARDAIDGVRALLEILERRVPAEVRPLRDGLSQLQVAYASEVQRAGSAGGSGAAAAEPPGAQVPPSAPPAPGAGDPAGKDGKGEPGPAQASGRLWVPGR
jgi:hypothetical protein